MTEKKNCYDCNHRIGNTCMEHAVMLKQKNGLPAQESDKELLKSLCWCETGIGGTQYELKRKAKNN
jgi:hypothetical protein